MKQAIVIRNDLKLPKGKACAQAAHASVEAALKSESETLSKWRRQGAAKIVLKTENEKNLIELMQYAKDCNLKTALITDAGKTVIAPGTKTAIAIGPAKDEEVDKVTGNLKLF